ncbi:hypothetical protein [Streptomyces sp. NBC_00576]|uniref:hypothetical protein n=1 Tax=Streptomyces sp. NBC_00576 TaxID=2903665 RepID=UPI002E81BCAC|nr:hypothetical protein [Streptomyces sp. NBC_00576]WUB70020.1 hypothetical protein OG734_08020 [Streptomyces sp. NBC_00576]
MPTAVVTKGVEDAVNPPTGNLPTTARAGRPAAPNLDYDLPFIPIGTGTEAEAVAPAEAGTLLPGGQ